MRKIILVGIVLLIFQHSKAQVWSLEKCVSYAMENNLSIKVYGEKGGLEWRQMEPNSLIVRWLDQPMQIYRTGIGNLYPESTAHTRIPGGHPEGYLEAFANIYRNFAHCVKARVEGVAPDPLLTDYPTVEDGVRGMRFIEKVIASGKSNQKWVKF